MPGKEKVKNLAFYPFLFVLFVILTPLAHNLESLEISQAFIPAVSVGMATILLILLFHLASKDWRYACYLAFLLNVYFFGFSYLNRTIQDLLATFARTVDERLILGIFTLLIGILSFKVVWQRIGGKTWLAPYLNLVLAVWLLFPVFQMVSGYFLKPARAENLTVAVETEVGELELDCTHTPNIYYLILDAYGRSDSIQDLYHYDNQPFLEALKQRGFYIADDSYTNYTQTIYSIPASLNFNYMQPPGKGMRGQIYFSSLFRDNEIMKALRNCGYQTISIESGFFYTDHLDVDVYLERVIGFNEFESLLMANSPVDVLADELKLEPSEFSAAAHRQRVLYSFEMLETLQSSLSPIFVLAHILSPHPPFLFDAKGEPVNPTSPYYIGDGDDFLGTRSEYITGYRKQVQFVNQKVIEAIDTILANSVTPPIIIIQGDHGPGSHLVWDNPSKTCLWERTPILNAYYLPGDGEGSLYPSISPVNTFRLVLDAYFGADLPFLPDLTFFTSHRLERQAIDITAQRSSQANCSP